MRTLKSIFHFIAWAFAFPHFMPGQNPESTTHAATSLDDDWADIALQLEKENRHA